MVVSTLPCHAEITFALFAAEARTTICKFFTWIDIGVKANSVVIPISGSFEAKTAAALACFVIPADLLVAQILCVFVVDVLVTGGL